MNLPERPGNFGDLTAVYDAMGVSPLPLEVARQGSTRTQEGHPLTLPLIASLAAGGVSIMQETSATASPIAGWPAYAFDMHTRLGRTAISLFLARCQALPDLISEHVAPQDREAFTGTLVFRSEGACVDRRIFYSGSQAILLSAEIAHLTYFGLPTKRVTEALEVLQVHSELLHQCRLDIVRSAGK